MRYLPGGMKSAASQITMVTITSIVTGPGNWALRLRGWVGSPVVIVGLDIVTPGLLVSCPKSLLQKTMTSCRRTRDHSPGPTRALALEGDGIANQGAGHAVSAAPPAAELGPDNGDDLNPGFAQLGVRPGAAVIGDHHPGGQGDQIVAAVPLPALGGVVIPTGLDDPELLQVQRLRDHVDERFLLQGRLNPGGLSLGRREMAWTWSMMGG